jgi:hypothetical protein
MKFLSLLFLSFSLSFPALSQEKRPELTPEQKIKGALVLANAATALVVGPVFLPAAILTGKKEGLCNLLGGKYRPDAPQGEDQCPGGIWLRTIPYIADLAKE